MIKFLFTQKVWQLTSNWLLEHYVSLWFTVHIPIEHLLCTKKIICQTVRLERMKVNLVIFSVQFIFQLINETGTTSFSIYALEVNVVMCLTVLCVVMLNVVIKTNIKSVWVVTWLSAALWHSYKCCSQKSEMRFITPLTVYKKADLYPK